MILIFALIIILHVKEICSTKNNNKKNYNNNRSENLWNMKVTVIPIVTGALGTITKRLVKGLKDFEITVLYSHIQIQLQAEI